MVQKQLRLGIKYRSISLAHRALYTCLPANGVSLLRLSSKSELSDAPQASQVHSCRSSFPRLGSHLFPDLSFQCHLPIGATSYPLAKVGQPSCSVSSCKYHCVEASIVLIYCHPES